MGELRLEEWRNLPAAETARLYARERARWLEALHWESTPSWAIVEAAREAGQLPGFVARAAGDELQGWTFFLVRGGTLQVGALVGDRADIVRGLLDAVLASPEADLARRYQCFVFPESGSVQVALERRRFAVEHYLYLERSLGTDASLDERLEARAWREADLPEAVRLLARAYAGTGSARCFAPDGRLDEWTTYLGQLVRTEACGRFVPDESFSLDRPGGLGGVILATRLDPATSHIAQIAIDPSSRRQGRARALVAAATRAARERGAERQTLLVASANAAARALYDQLGFRERGRFIFAERDRITRTVARTSEPSSRDETPHRARLTA